MRDYHMLSSRIVWEKKYKGKLINGDFKENLDEAPFFLIRLKTKTQYQNTVWNIYKNLLVQILKLNLFKVILCDIKSAIKFYCTCYK